MIEYSVGNAPVVENIVEFPFMKGTRNRDEVEGYW